MFLEDIPVDENSELGVLLDLKRFDGATPFLSQEDRGYFVSTDDGDTAFRRPVQTARNHWEWVASGDPLELYEIEMGPCVAGVRLDVELCDVELYIQLPVDVLEEPVEDEIPGFGIAVVDNVRAGSFPEELTSGAPPPDAPDTCGDFTGFCPQVVCNAAVCAANSACCTGWSATCEGIAAMTTECIDPTCDGFTGACYDDDCRAAICAVSSSCCNHWSVGCSAATGAHAECDFSCHDSEYCEDQFCRQAVADGDSFCENHWDGDCEDAAELEDECNPESCNAFTGFCEDEFCREQVWDGDINDTWCRTSWDGLCEEEAESVLACDQRAMDRSYFHTLLFGDEAGERAPLKIVSFNARRFTSFMASVDPDVEDWEDVDIADIATLLAEDYDVIGLQEVWSEAEADAILEGINDFRELNELPLMHLYGPVQFEQALLEPLEWAVDELHGGLWILSHYPVVAMGNHVYDACMGEDCVKAKGVLWVRLNLQPEGAPLPNCPNCPARSRSELFVDVFNTHMNAVPVVCGGGDDATAVAAALELGFEGGFLATYVASEWNCNSVTPAETRAAQLEEMANFIDEVAASDRPSIILGDFNIDGQQLGRNGDDYGTLLDALGLLASGGDAEDDDPDDSLPYPRDIGLLDSIDEPRLVHADVARDSFDDWAQGIGTSIGSTEFNPMDVNALHDRDSDTVPDGKGRIDYILIRAGAGEMSGAVSLTRIEAHGAGPVWNNVWPQLAPIMSYAPAGTGERLSDHMAVEADLEVIRVRQPGLFHPEVPHTFEVKVTSVDAQAESDCFLDVCGPGEPYVDRIRGVGALGGGSYVETMPSKSAHCDGWNLSGATDTCMADWIVSDTYDPATDEFHMGAFSLWEYDSVGGDEYLSTMPSASFPRMGIDWPAFGEELPGLVIVRDWAWATPGGWEDLSYQDPVDYCTRDQSIQMCLELLAEELAP